MHARQVARRACGQACMWPGVVVEPGVHVGQACMLARRGCGQDSTQYGIARDSTHMVQYSTYRHRAAPTTQHMRDGTHHVYIPSLSKQFEAEQAI